MSQLHSIWQGNVIVISRGRFTRTSQVPKEFPGCYRREREDEYSSRVTVWIINKLELATPNLWSCRIELQLKWPQLILVEMYRMNIEDRDSSPSPLQDMLASIIDQYYECENSSDLQMVKLGMHLEKLGTHWNRKNLKVTANDRFGAQMSPVHRH